MNPTRIRTAMLPLLLAGLLPLPAQSAEPAKGPIQRELSAELAQARREVRAELATARAELETENLDVGNSLRLGKAGNGAGEELPKAEITPRGDFLIEGKAVAIDAGQREQLLAYRGHVIDIAKAGIDIGERSAQAALDAVDRGLFSLMFGAMTGSLERRIEKTVRETVEPGVRQICLSLPALRDRQQRLSATLPAFRPYATLEADDVEDCENELRREFASR